MLNCSAIIQLKYENDKVIVFLRNSCDVSLGRTLCMEIPETLFSVRVIDEHFENNICIQSYIVMIGLVLSE